MPNNEFRIQKIDSVPSLTNKFSPVSAIAIAGNYLAFATGKYIDSNNEAAGTLPVIGLMETSGTNFVMEYALYFVNTAFGGDKHITIEAL